MLPRCDNNLLRASVLLMALVCVTVCSFEPAGLEHVPDRVSQNAEAFAFGGFVPRLSLACARAIAEAATACSVLGVTGAIGCGIAIHNIGMSCP